MFRGIMNRLYNGNPNKPDLTPEDMPKSKLELYFACLGSNLGNLFKTNLVFLFAMLPFVVWTVISLMAYIQLFSAVETLDESYMEQMLTTIQTYLWGCIPTLTLAGPPCAGLIFSARNYARDEHVFIWADFKDAMKENWKQSMLVMLLFSTFLACGFYAVRFYGQAEIAGTGSLFGVLQIVMLLLFLVVLLALLYVFPLLVGYEVKLGLLLKNSFLLAFGKLPMSLLFTLLNLLPVLLGCVLMLYTPYAFIVMVAYYALFGFAFAAYTTCAYCNALFEKVFPQQEVDEGEETA